MQTLVLRGVALAGSFSVHLAWQQASAVLADGPQPTGVGKPSSFHPMALGHLHRERIPPSDCMSKGFLWT